MSSKPLKSEVWVHFIKTNEGGICKHCLKEVKGVGNTTNLKKHLLRRHGHSQTDVSVGGGGSDITTALLYMIAVDNQPLSITEKTGFKNLTKIAFPQYNLPSTETVTSLMAAKYQVVATRVKEEIKEVDFLCLTTNTSRDTVNDRGFLGLTVHYIKNSKINSITIGLYELHESTSTQCLAKGMLKFCGEWNLSADKVMAVVTENDCAISEGIAEGFGPNKLLHCFAHTLELVANKVLTNDQEVSDIVSKIEFIVGFFKRNGKAARALRNAHKGSESQVNELIQSVPNTSWNLTYYLLQRFQKLSHHIASALSIIKESTPMLDETELDVLGDIINLLCPIEEARKDISEDNFTTCSKVIPIVHGISCVISRHTPKTETGRASSSNLIQDINSRFGKVETNPIYSVATLLDPRFKSKVFKGSANSSKAIQTVKRTLETYSETTTQEIIPTPSIKSAPSLIWTYTQIVSNSNDVPLDLELFLSEPAKDLASDPILFWQQYIKTSPSLASIAQSYMCIPATSSVHSESLFSNNGRSDLSNESLSQLAFLGSLDKSYWYNW